MLDGGASQDSCGNENAVRLSLMRFAKLGALLRATGIVLAFCLIFGIADSGVAWAGTPVVRSIRTIKKGSPFSLVDLAVDPTTDTVYASNGIAVFVINGATDKVLRTIHVKNSGLAIAVNPTTNTVYLANGKSISVMNGATDKVLRTIHLYAGITAIAVDPTTDTVYVGMSQNSSATYFDKTDAKTLSVINGATDKVTRTVELNRQVLEFAVDPTTDTLYLNNGNSISVINGATDKVTGIIDAAGLVAVDPTTDTLYLANGKSISVVNGATDKVTGTVHAESAGIGLAVDPTTDTVYATDGDSVSAISFVAGSDRSASGVIIGLVGLVVIGGSGAAWLSALRRRRTVGST